MDGIQSGANDFLVKPVDKEDVVLRVRNAIYTKKLYDQVQENYRRLQELEKLRDNLTHMIVHDMRSPLTSVSGHLQLLKKRAQGKLSESELENLKLANGSALQLIEMVSSLLDVTRLEEGEMPLNRQPLTLVRGDLMS